MCLKSVISPEGLRVSSLKTSRKTHFMSCWIPFSTEQWKSWGHQCKYFCVHIWNQTQFRWWIISAKRKDNTLQTFKHLKYLNLCCTGKQSVRNLKKVQWNARSRTSPSAALLHSAIRDCWPWVSEQCLFVGSAFHAEDLRISGKLHQVTASMYVAEGSLLLSQAIPCSQMLCFLYKRHITKRRKLQEHVMVPETRLLLQTPLTLAGVNACHPKWKSAVRTMKSLLSNPWRSWGFPEFQTISAEEPYGTSLWDVQRDARQPI